MKRLVNPIGRFFLLPRVLMVAGLGTSVAAREVNVGYQRIYNPWRVMITDGKFEPSSL